MSKQIFVRAVVLTLSTSLSYSALSESQKTSQLSEVFDLASMPSSGRLSPSERVIKDFFSDLQHSGTGIGKFTDDAGDRIASEKFNSKLSGIVCQIENPKKLRGWHCAN